MSPFLNELHSSTNIQVLSDVDDINRECNLIFDLDKHDVIALDTEWVVTRNSTGRITGSKAVALIQVGYIDDEDRSQAILIRTAKFKKKRGIRVLPHRLEALLVGNINIVGVNVSADLARIGRDFNVDAINSVVQKN